jgi:oligopeptide transport system substrate-binding protein
MVRMRLILLRLCFLPLCLLPILSQYGFTEVKGKEDVLQGGLYRRPLEFMPRTLDPALTTDIYSVAIVQQLFDGLVQFDKNLNVIPAIAKSWMISPDGLTYTFFLKEGVKFHNGSEVTADDFVYSFSRVIDPKNRSIASKLLEKVVGFKEFQDGKANFASGFRSVDKYIFEIRLSEPFSPFISALGTIHFKVVPKAEVEKPSSAFAKAPVGTGPFKFLSLKEKEEIILEKNPDYFEGRPYLDKIIFRIFHGAPREKIFKEFKEGGLEESFIPPGEIEEIAKDKNFLFVKKPMLSLRYYGFNSLSKPLNNKELRKAMNFAIDKNFIISEIHKNQFNVAKGILPPGMPGYDPQKNPYSYNKIQVRKSLLKAGYPEGQGLPTLQIWSASNSEAAQKELNEIQSQLRKIRITTNINFETNWPNFVSMLKANQAPIFIHAWYADFPDPDNFLGTLFHSQSQYNFTAYRNSEVDRLLDQARTERDYLKRIETYRKIEEIILEDAPIVPMVNHLFQMVYQPYVRGIDVNALGGHYIPMKKIWLKKER